MFYTFKVPKYEDIDLARIDQENHDDGVHVVLVTVRPRGDVAQGLLLIHTELLNKFSEQEPCFRKDWGFQKLYISGYHKQLIHFRGEHVNLEPQALRHILKELDEAIGRSTYIKVNVHIWEEK